MTQVVLAVAVVVVAVIAATMAKMALPQTRYTRIGLNLMYFFFLLVVFVVVATTLDIDIGSGKFVASAALVAGIIAITQAPLQDVMAFTIVYLHRMYNVGDVLRVGKHMGQVKAMTLTTVTLENTVTKMRIELPHRMVFMNFTRI